MFDQNFGRRTRRGRFCTAVSTFALTTVFALPIPAEAQTSNPPTESPSTAPDDPGQSLNDGVEEIVVTARKREENLRDVPIAVTAVSGESLVEKNIARLTDLATVVPNFTLSLSALQPLTFIRGFGSGGSPSFEQSVGKFVDNVSYGRDFDARIPLYDIERLEVLKGPQVLLYGNSATAGALNITTKKPGRSFEADASATYEFVNNEVTLQGGVTTPLSEWASLRVAGIYQDLSRGWIYNAANGRREPTFRTFGIRPTLKLTPTPDLEVTLKVEVDRLRHEGAVSQPIRQAAAPSRSFAEAELDNRRNSNYDVAPFFMKEFADLDMETYQGDVVYDMLGGTLTSTTAYRNAHLPGAQGNGGDRPVTILLIDQRYDQFSQELRFSGRSGPLDYLVGGYYQSDSLNIFVWQPLNLSVFGLPIPRFSRLATLDQTSKSYSAFGDFTYHFSDRLRFSAGARYSIIRKLSDQSSNPTNFLSGLDADTERPPASVVNPALNGLFISVFGAIPHTFTDIKTEEDHFQPQVIAQYDFAPGHMAYAKYVSGAKAGGVDYQYGGSVARGATPADAQFTPETAKSFELGVKGITSDRTFEYALAAYNTTFTNLQTSVFLGSALFVTNVGEARTRGVELEMHLAPTRGLRINGSAAYQDSKFLSYPDAPCTVQQALATPAGVVCRQDLSGAVTPFSSKFTAGLGFNYEQPVSEEAYVLGAGASIFYKSRFNTSTNIDPLGDQAPFATIDAHVDLRPSQGWWSLSLFARNITDKMYKEYSVGTPLVPGGFNTFLSRGRQLGIRLGAQF